MLGFGVGEAVALVTLSEARVRENARVPADMDCCVGFSVLVAEHSGLTCGGTLMPSEVAARRCMGWGAGLRPARGGYCL